MMKDHGLITLRSEFPQEQTVERVQHLLETEGFHIFTIIDHGESARKHGRKLEPTQLIIFGNPKTGGTGLMQENQEIAIDLPAKILVWTDEEHNTHITFNDMQWVANRHGLSHKNQQVIDSLRSSIHKICSGAATKK